MQQQNSYQLFEQAQTILEKACAVYVPRIMAYLLRFHSNARYQLEVWSAESFTRSHTQNSMAFVKFRMSSCTDFHHSLVISKHIALCLMSHTKVTQCYMQVNYLFISSPSRYKHRFISCSSTDVCLLEYYLMWVWLTKWNIPVTEQPNIMSWYKFASS